MKVIVYGQIPSIDQWKSDSSVTFAKRHEEPGFLRLDELIETYGNSLAKDTIRGPLLIDIFLTIEYWFKMRDIRHPSIHEGRIPAIRGLFDIVVKMLSPYFAERDGTTSSAKVAMGIKHYTSLGMSEHGYQVDDAMGFAKFNESQVWSYRLWFQNGRAYQVPWWAGQVVGPMVLANSEHGYVPMIRRDGGNLQNPVKPGEKGWSPFIMTLSRMIYMAKHDFDSRRRVNNYFHSSYTGGYRVGMAGTIGIKDGLIRGIRLDSGHYKPGLHSLTNFLQALKMYQVDLKKITLLDYAGERIGSNTANADDFLWSGKTWENFRKGATEEYRKDDATRDLRIARVKP